MARDLYSKTNRRGRLAIAGRNMTAALCLIKKTAKGSPPLFNRYELAEKSLSYATGSRYFGVGAKATIWHFRRKKWIAPARSKGAGIYYLTRRGTKAAGVACSLIGKR